MAHHISFRDITFHPSLTGVRIIATTDIPCHLYCRLSEKQPWIHKKPVLRRGLWLNDDVRFCFVAFEDNEQFEPGDTYIHTWWKTNWPFCTTKFLYLWGTVSGEVSISSSPIFEYHNTGEAPVPPPDTMKQLNCIDPQFLSLTGTSTWRTKDVSRDLPEGATGAILQIKNSNLGSERDLALRKPGATYDSPQPVGRGVTLWVIVGLDADRHFEYKAEAPDSVYCYLMGYTGRDVVFPDVPIDIKPTINDAYQTKDIKSTWPDAVFILTDMGSPIGWEDYHSIRPLGSTKEVYQGSRRKFPFCGVPASGKIETKLMLSEDDRTQWLAYAYLKTGCSFSLNGFDFLGFTSDTWKLLNVDPLGPDTRWVFLEYFHPFGSQPVSARKHLSYFNFQGLNSNHGWMITHVHQDLQCEVYSGTTNPTDQLLGLAESH